MNQNFQNQPKNLSTNKKPMQMTTPPIKTKTKVTAKLIIGMVIGVAVAVGLGAVIMFVVSPGLEEEKSIDLDVNKLDEKFSARSSYINKIEKPKKAGEIYIGGVSHPSGLGLVTTDYVFRYKNAAGNADKLKAGGENELGLEKINMSDPELCKNYTSEFIGNHSISFSDLKDSPSLNKKEYANDPLEHDHAKSFLLSPVLIKIKKADETEFTDPEIDRLRIKWTSSDIGVFLVYPPEGSEIQQPMIFPVAPGKAKILVSFCGKVEESPEIEVKSDGYENFNPYGKLDTRFMSGWAIAEFTPEDFGLDENSCFKSISFKGDIVGDYFSEKTGYIHPYFWQENIKEWKSGNIADQTLSYSFHPIGCVPTVKVALNFVSEAKNLYNYRYKVENNQYKKVEVNHEDNKASDSAWPMKEENDFIVSRTDLNDAALKKGVASLLLVGGKLETGFGEKSDIYSPKQIFVFYKKKNKLVTHTSKYLAGGFIALEPKINHEWLLAEENVRFYWKDKDFEVHSAGEIPQNQKIKAEESNFQKDIPAYNNNKAVVSYIHPTAPFGFARMEIPNYETYKNEDDFVRWVYPGPATGYSEDPYLCAKEYGWGCFIEAGDFYKPISALILPQENTALKNLHVEAKLKKEKAPFSPQPTICPAGTTEKDGKCEPMVSPLTEPDTETTGPDTSGTDTTVDWTKFIESIKCVQTFKCVNYGPLIEAMETNPNLLDDITAPEKTPPPTTDGPHFIEIKDIKFEYRGADRVIVKWKIDDAWYKKRIETLKQGKSEVFEETDLKLKYLHMPNDKEMAKKLGPADWLVEKVYYNSKDDTYYAVLGEGKDEKGSSKALLGGEAFEKTDKDFIKGSAVYSFMLVFFDARSGEETRITTGVPFTTLNHLQTILYLYNRIYGNEENVDFVGNMDPKACKGGRCDGATFWYNTGLDFAGVKYAMMHDPLKREYMQRFDRTVKEKGSLWGVERLFSTIHDRIYPEDLGKVVDPEGSNFWRNQIDSQKINWDGVMTYFFVSPEYNKGLIASQGLDKTLASFSYLTALGRPGVEKDLNWLAQTYGTSSKAMREDLLGNFVEKKDPKTGKTTKVFQFKAEPKERIEKIDKEVGREEALSYLYLAVFGRPIDPSGQKFYAEKMKKDNLTFEQIAGQLLQSKEFQEHGEPAFATEALAKPL